MFYQEVLLALRGYLPVLYPLLFICIFLFSMKKIDSKISKLVMIVGSSLVAATIMTLLCYSCNIIFNVDNPIYKDPIYSMIACSAVAVLLTTYTKTERNKSRYIYKCIVTFFSVGIFVSAFKPLCQMAWFIHKLHLQ